MGKVKYDNQYKCPKCGSDNNIWDDDWWPHTIMLECKTECTCCGHKDYWVHGRYEGKGEKENYEL